MAEYCFECYKKFHGENRKEENYIISDELDLCEGCGEYKNVVICYKREGIYNNVELFLNILIYPLRFIKNLVFFLFRK